jgi:tetratricopeptide (TPR) repeat protein
MIGRTVGRYQILERIGAGGMGVVYRARDTQLKRSVALKVVGERAPMGGNARARLLREARTASTLNHPNICTIYEAGEADGEAYIAMELVEGRPLNAMVSDDGLPAETVIRYGVQIADALAHAHERGVIHRDLKSPNVIITPEGRPKVLDFGLAKQVIQGSEETTLSEVELTEAGAVVGTLSYMAPEVLSGESADARSDLWALGVMLYHAVTGRLPFRGSTAYEITSAILRDSAPLPARAPPGLAAIIRRLLAKPPGERYQRAGEVRAALEAIQPGAEVSGPVPLARVSRRRWLWAAGAAPVAGVLVWMGIQRRASPPPAPRLSDGSRPSANPEANEYFERHLLAAGTGPRHDPPQARRMLDRALALDPKFAAARAAYAFTHMLALYQGDSNDPSLVYKAEEEARQALRDDPGCGGAHTVLAGTYLLQGRKELVPGEVDEALKANPNDLAALMWLPLYHRINGDYEQAIRQTQQIITRWPLFWPARFNLGELLREHGDMPGAIRALERILESDPESRIALWALARAHMDSGDLPKARQALESVDAQHRPNYRGRLCWALLLALERKRTEALREMDGPLQTYAGTVYLGSLWVTEFYALMGDTGKALEWLDRAARTGDDRESWLRRDPHLASIREHLHFQQMLASVAYRRKQRAAGGEVR